MDIIELRDFCLSLPHAEEATPFDETTLVYKIGGRIFALTDMEDSGRINLKCDPDRAIELRERHPEIVPGWHMNKRHWNTVTTDGDLPDEMVREIIRDSYRLVFRSLPRTVQRELAAPENGETPWNG